MSAAIPVRRRTRPTRIAGALDDIACGLPVAIALTAIVWRLGGAATAIGVGIVAAAGVATIAWWRSRRFGTGWLVHRLNAARGDIEDSADLLFADPASLGPLQTMQRARIAARLAEAPPVLRPARSARRPAAAWALGALSVAAALLWPSPPRSVLAPSAEGLPPAPGVPRLVGQRLRIVPPPYTGLPARDLDTLDVRAPQGSRLVWMLAFAPPPNAAKILFLDGRRVALTSVSGLWRATAMLDRSALYRIAPAGARAAARLHRLDAVADRPPRVMVRSPARTLTIAAATQARWPLLFEASDDYGVAPTATLHITVASGDGEQVTFRDHMLLLRGTGPARARRFAVSLDLAALGFAGPGDLVAELTIADNRAPSPQRVRAPSLVLRRLPARADQASGLDGAVRSALPAFLRSQRQVVNDAEELIRGRRTLSPARFAARAQSIGGDQHALRMHYGEFLGQENEGHDLAPPIVDAPSSPILGHQEDVLADYGHRHDEAESATLFDPATKARLTDAVDQMWRSELALDQDDPTRALPYARRALILIKQVQQATRVFLARVGTADLPPIDEKRRLTGVRADMGRDDLALSASAGDDGGAARAWAALVGAGHAGDLDVVARWSRSGAAQAGDPLAIAAALDAARHDPGCAACRDRLRALVWRALRRPTPGVPGRGDGGKVGARYLDALGGGE